MGYGVRFKQVASLHGRLPRGLFSAVFLVSLFLFSWAGCERRETGRSQGEQRPVPVNVVTVEPRDIPVSFEYIAQVQSSRQVSIQARVSGFLEKRTYTEGAIVQKGDTLFLMDQKPFQAQLDQAVAALARQQAAFDVARLNLARVKPLTEANALSQKDLDDARGQYQSAAAAVEQAKATVDQAKLNLSYTVITSPVTGITSSAQQADGTYLSPSNSELTTVTVLSPAYVNFSVSENDWLRYSNQIASGRLIAPKNREYTVEIVLADGSVYPHSGKLTFAEPSFDARTGTFLIRATVENPNGVLRPNQYVRIHLKGAVRPKAILVPQRAVQQSSKGHFVWVVKDGKAEQRPVVTGGWQGENWVIQEGLHPGDQVAVEGTVLLTLRPGASVEATPLAPDAGAESVPAADKRSVKRGG